MYARSSLSNKRQLECWRNTALQSIADGNGAQISSGSANGQSFGLTVAKITNTDWFEVLQSALDQVERFQKGFRRGVSRGTVRRDNNNGGFF